jgi:4a-hydroxytetrahydrobiopterin dehydratase
MAIFSIEVTHMAVLAELKCTVCKEGDIPLDRDEIAELHDKVPDWEVIRENGIDKLKRTFRFKDFKSALEFTNEIGDEAEKEDHHPVITLSWGRVTVVWWTHKIDGLHKNDFIMAARTDETYKEGHFEKAK